MRKYNFIVFFLCVSITFSQEKNEKEERVQESEFPKQIHSYFDTVFKDLKHLKYYKETDGGKISYEIKFKYNRLRYSIEFDTLGRLEDIEISIKKRYIPKAILLNISTYFDSHYKKTRLLKIQKQYVNDTKKSDKDFILYILKQFYKKKSFYEIVADTKTNISRGLYEFIFDEQGNFKSFRKVTPSSYEHALY